MSNIGVSVQNLKLNLNGQQLLSIHEIKCFPKECLCLVGANGSGKSLLLESLCGIYHNGKSVQYFRKNGDIIKYLSPRRIRIGAMLQRFSLWPRVKMSELIKLVESFSGKQFSKNDFILSIKDRLYKNLSVGEKQFLYFWLITNSASDIWIFDEPTMGMDACNYSLVMKTLRSRNLAAICAFHNFRDVLTVADKCYFICHGTAIPLNVISSEDLSRTALVKIIKTDSEDNTRCSSQCISSKHIEIESENDVELMNREIIPLVEAETDIENISINLIISKNVYVDYRKEDF
jgi:ABC-type multidrug transport system ATPase subunit